MGAKDVVVVAQAVAAGSGREARVRKADDARGSRGRSAGLPDFADVSLSDLRSTSSTPLLLWSVTLG